MENESYTLGSYISIIRKRIWMVLSIPLIITLATLLFSTFVMTPIYQAKTDLLVLNSAPKTTSVTVNNSQPVKDKNGKVITPASQPVQQASTAFADTDIDTSLKLVATYQQFIKSDLVMSAVYSEIGKSIDLPSRLFSTTGSEDPVTRMSDLVQVDTYLNSQLITITAKQQSARKAEILADTVAETFQQQLLATTGVNNVKILSKAKADPKQVSPNTVLYSIIAFCVGLIISLLIAFILGNPKPKVKTIRTK